jgi:hypothetical protein
MVHTEDAAKINIKRTMCFEQFAALNLVELQCSGSARSLVGWIRIRIQEAKLTYKNIKK